MYCYFQYAFLCGHLEENKATRQGFEVACMRCIAQNSAASPPSPRVFKSQPSRSRQHHDFVFLFSILIMASLGPVVPLQHLNSSGNNTSGGQPAPSPSAPNQSVTVPPHSLSSLPATPSTLITAVPTSNVLDTSGPSTLNGSIGCAPSSGATTITTASTATTATIPPLPHRPFKQEHRLIRLATSAKVWTVLGGILGFIAFIYTIILNKWTARNDALQACNSMPVSLYYLIEELVLTNRRTRQKARRTVLGSYLRALRSPLSGGRCSSSSRCRTRNTRISVLQGV